MKKIRKVNKKIYLLQNENSLRYKIGISKNIKNRIKQVQTGADAKVILIKEFDSKYATTVESIIKRHYRQYNTSGEWFQLNETHVEEFISLCEMFEKNLSTIDNSEDDYYNDYLKRI